MTLLTVAEPKVDHGRPRVTVLLDRCAGCEECIVRCPTGALSLDTKRWVAEADNSLCVGCRQCSRTCPFSAIEVSGPALVAERAELPTVRPGVLLQNSDEVRCGLSNWAGAVQEAKRCLTCPDPTCVRGCPAHNDIPAFIQAVKNRDLGLAHEILRRTSVLPDICSRVCDQSAQCEGACTWSLAGERPVAIGALERFVADSAEVPPVARRSQNGRGLSVGIIGSGPAGIAAAWELIEAGASVTVYEKDQEPGGLLGWGIPDFTLPKSVAERPWTQLRAAGVQLICGTEVRPEDLGRLRETHDAIITAQGASVPIRLPVPGGELEGVVDATTFLKRAKAILEQSGPTAVDNSVPAIRPAGADRPLRVLVLGAGNTGMDVARTARRLGNEATCVDWLDRRFAIVRPDELAEAVAEGVEPWFSTTLIRLEGSDGHVQRAIVARTSQSRSDERPKVVGRDTESLAVDLVVMAMGYRTDPALAATLPGTPVRRQANGLPDCRWTASGILASHHAARPGGQPVGTVALGREAGMKAAELPLGERLWGAGDVLIGPATVVEAMAHGRRAAQAILLSQPQRKAS